MVKGNAGQTGSHLPWAGKMTRIEDVEDELSYLWHMSADNVRTSQNINVRTSVLNFVICAPDIPSAQQVSARLRALSSTHLARVILVILDPDQPTSDVSAWVTLRSFSVISDMMRHHFEQITVMATGDAVRHIAQSIQPLFKPDLPVYLWWLHNLSTSNHAFSQLVHLSNRVIIDSSTFANPKESLQALPSLMRSAAQSSITDLNWGRITPWRELIAQFFDVAEYKPYLAGINAVEIEYAASTQSQQDHTIQSNPTQAWLLASWLKTRLGWRRAADAQQSVRIAATPSGSYMWRMIRPALTSVSASNGGPTGTTSQSESLTQGHLLLRPCVQQHTVAGMICLVRMQSNMDEKHATFSIHRQDDTDHVLTSVQFDQGTRPTRTVKLAPTSQEEELLHDELEFMRRDQLYEETISELLNLLAEG